MISGFWVSIREIRWNLGVLEGDVRANFTGMYFRSSIDAGVDIHVDCMP